MKRLVLIAHNLRSAHNVGSLLRTSDGLGVNKVYLTGYSPFPASDGDVRLPHEAQRTEKQISKTALGAEHSQPWEYYDDVQVLITYLREEGYTIAALEQSENSQSVGSLIDLDKIALIVGREVEGIESEVIASADSIVEIPMLGQKESYNVVQAAAMALYHLRFLDQ